MSSLTKIFSCSGSNSRDFLLAIFILKNIKKQIIDLKRLSVWREFCIKCTFVRCRYLRRCL